MNVRASLFGFGKIGFLFLIATLMAGSFTVKSAEPSSFEIRQVVEERDSAGAETLPFAHTQSGAENSLRVMKQAVLDGSDVARATTQKDPITGDNGVLVSLTEKGKERFAALTERSIGKRLAVVVDGKIMVAPVVRTKIPGGSLVISGNLTQKEAADLAAKFNEKSRGK
jgi:preprotein translocase subunit SecD